MEAVFFRTRHDGPGGGPSSPYPLRAELARLQDFLRKTLGVPALVIYLPDFSAATPQDRELQDSNEKSFLKTSRELGLPFHDLGADFKGRAADGLLLWKEHPFLNSSGHRVVAATVSQHVMLLLRSSPNRGSGKPKPRPKPSAPRPIS